MKHRRDDADDIALVDMFLDHHGMRRDRPRAVAGEHPLGQARGAAGIGHRERVALVDLHIRLVGAVARNEFVERPADRDIGFDPGAAVAHRVDLFGEQVFVDQRLHVGLVKHVLQFVRRIQHRHVDQHAAGFRRAEKHDAVFGAVARHDADLVALLQAEPGQRMREAVGVGIEIGIAGVPAFPDDGRLLRKPHRGPAQHVSRQHVPFSPRAMRAQDRRRRSGSGR